MIQAVDRITAAPAASLALLIIELAEVGRLQARLGFGESAMLMRAMLRRFADALGERGQFFQIGDGRLCALVSAIRNSGHAVLAAEKLCRASEDVFNALEIPLQPNMHIGISLYPSQAKTAEALLQLAQLASEAARWRTARIVVFDEKCESEVITPWALSGEFSQALAAGDLSVHYQPQISMLTGKPWGVESLMRWIRDGKTVVPPDTFIPLAEEAGLMSGATWYSLSNSLRTATDYAELHVAVNITAGTLHHRDFIDMLRSALTTWSGAATRLTLEITEGALIKDFAEATVRLKSLRDMGVRISIDDFGTGYSSLSYFKKIPADEIKIDKSFILGMTADPGDRHIVKTIIELSKHFHLEVVAEGVENRETLDMLAAFGCDYAQGFLFSPAISATDLRQWLANNSRDLR